MLDDDANNDQFKQQRKSYLIEFTHPNEEELYNILIRLEMTSVSNDIWKVISEYGYGEAYQCNKCKDYLDSSQFSNAQIKKGNRKCMNCTGVKTGGSTLGKFTFKCSGCKEYKPKYQFKDPHHGSKCRNCDTDIHQYECNGCGTTLDSNKFSKSQRRKRNRKCMKCTGIYTDNK